MSAKTTPLRCSVKSCVSGGRGTLDASPGHDISLRRAFAYVSSSRVSALAQESLLMKSQGLPWFKCIPRVFREGMIGLTPEERGAYVTVILLIYERGEPIPDDAGWVAAHLAISVRNWTKLRSTLIVKSKIFETVVNGRTSLMDERAAKVISEQNDFRCKLSTNATIARAAKSATKENRTLAGASKAKPSDGLSSIETASKPKSLKIEDKKIPPISSNDEIAPPIGGLTTAKAKRAEKFVPESWQPSPAHFAKAIELGFGPELVHTEEPKFREFEFKNGKTSFDLAFHRWLRTSAERRGSNYGRGSPASTQPSGISRKGGNIVEGLVEAPDTRQRQRWGL